MHIVDLSCQVGLTFSNEETARHPVDVGMLEEVGRGRPLDGPADEPDHLLTVAIVIDDSSSRSSGKVPGGCKLSKFSGNFAICDGHRIVPETLA